jgi:4-hydroxymandelate oxidase
MVALFDPTLSWRDVEALAGMSSLPVVVKGILAGADARLAVDHGAAAVAVSNHGGRQLDGAIAALDALPEVVAAVAGQVPVLVDGGVRRGSDAVTALALGAGAVMVGRPVVWGLAAGGEAGALDVLELLREEVRLALALLGCPGPDDVGREHVVARGS